MSCALAVAALAAVARVPTLRPPLPFLGARASDDDTCAARVRAATRDSRFYAFDLFMWTPFNVRGDYVRDPPDENVLRAKTTTAEFMYPQWLRAPLLSDPRRVADPTDANLMLMTDSMVDVSPFIAKFVWHATHPEKTPDSWTRLDEWWTTVDGDAAGRKLVAEAKERIRALRDEIEDAGAAEPRWAYLLPSEWMFSRDDMAPELRLREALRETSDDGAMSAVTDFDDDGPALDDVVTTVPFTVHTTIAEALLKNRGEVDYAAKKHRTFFKGTGDRGAEGALRRQTSARTAMRALVGKKGHDVFLTSDDMSDEKMRRAGGMGYAEGMSSSTFCWIPRGDNPTSRRIFDAVAAGCVPVVVSDDIARYLPFRWAVDWRAMILQVPEKVFAKHPEEVAEAVLALPDAVVDALRARMDAARYALLWNDREAPEETCGGMKKKRRAAPCSEAPTLYLDEMLYRAKTGNFDVDEPLCEAKKDDPRWNFGGAWNAKGSCPPWLKMKKLCG